MGMHSGWGALMFVSNNRVLEVVDRRHIVGKGYATEAAAEVRDMTARSPSMDTVDQFG